MSACPVPSCTHEVGRGKLLCLRHWLAVPVPLQRQVNSTWRDFQASSGTLKLRALTKYRVARDAAIAAASGVPA